MQTMTLKQRLPGLILTLVGCGLLFHSFDDQYASTLMGLEYGPMFYPRIVLGVWLLLSVSSIFYLPDAIRSELQAPRKHGKAVLLALLLSGYVLSLDYLGFLISTFIAGVLSQLLLGYAYKAKSLLWAALIAVSCWASFEYIIGISLPSPIFL